MFVPKRVLTTQKHFPQAWINVRGELRSNLFAGPFQGLLPEQLLNAAGTAACEGPDAYLTATSLLVEEIRKSNGQFLLKPVLGKNKEPSVLC